MGGPTRTILKMKDTNKRININRMWDPESWHDMRPSLQLRSSVAISWPLNVNCCSVTLTYSPNLTVMWLSVIYSFSRHIICWPRDLDLWLFHLKILSWVTFAGFNLCTKFILFNVISFLSYKPKWYIYADRYDLVLWHYDLKTDRRVTHDMGNLRGNCLAFYSFSFWS